MSRHPRRAPLARCLTVWATTSAVAIPLIATCIREAVSASPTSFESLVRSGCAVALASCVMWLWTSTGVVTLGAARGGSGVWRGCPSGLRRLVLAACGLAMLVPTPAAAEPDGAPDQINVLTGLPLPDRPTMPGTRRPATSTWGSVVVRDGDSLWSIARRSLPRAAGPVEIDPRWRAIWWANRHRIGSDPDLIHPGVELRLPREES